MFSKHKGRFIFMKKIRIAEISAALGLVISVVFSIIGFGYNCNEIRNNIVRLHILANSDSDEDQRVKLIVRDELLNCGKDLFSGIVNVENAEEILNNQKEDLLKIINSTLRENGFEYTADIFLVREYFNTRSYEDFTLPAGEYLAVKVILGKAEGKNWWCVMFPPLCLPAANKKEEFDIYINESGAEIVQNYQRYEMKFKIIEIYENIKNNLKANFK